MTGDARVPLICEGHVLVVSMPFLFTLNIPQSISFFVQIFFVVQLREQQEISKTKRHSKRPRPKACFTLK